MAENSDTLAPPRPVESLLGLFTPVGWGTAMQVSGVTAALIAETAADIMKSDKSSKMRLVAAKFLLDHSEKVLRFSGFMRETHTLAGVSSTAADGTTTLAAQIQSDCRLAADALSETELALSEAMGGRALPLRQVALMGAGAPEPEPLTLDGELDVEEDGCAGPQQG